MMGNDRRVNIRGTLTDDDGVVLDLGTLGPRQSAMSLPLPPCPDCGHDLVWAEIGYPPGTPPRQDDLIDPETLILGGARCRAASCGSTFRIWGRHDPRHDRRVRLRREWFF
jgi:hypothetical protein